MATEALTFVLVHGVWHGGWCWRAVTEILTSRGHRVTTPTSTGLGERSHLLSPSIDLSTFVDDLVNHLRWNDLTEVILVGHSFGGASITGAADRVPERIAKLLYLDGAVMENGETLLGLLPPEIAAQRRAAADEFSGGLSLPPAPAAFFGVEELTQAGFLEQRMTAHPFATFTTPLRLQHPPGNGLESHYIRCTDPVYETARLGLKRTMQKGWPVHELATGHDAMITAPTATADFLERLGRHHRAGLGAQLEH